MTRLPSLAGISAGRLAVGLVAGVIAAIALAQAPAAPESPNRRIYLYQGADRDQKLVEQAEKERQVVGYSTHLVRPEELRSTYEDLLNPRWTGRVTIEGTDTLWFASVVLAMGEQKGLAYFRKLAALKPSIRNSHILIAQLVAAGEVP